MRLAVKLGYDGFVGLQADVQSELARHGLGPHSPTRLPSDFLARVQAAEQDNAFDLYRISTSSLERSTFGWPTATARSGCYRPR